MPSVNLFCPYQITICANSTYSDVQLASFMGHKLVILEGANVRVAHIDHHFNFEISCCWFVNKLITEMTVEPNEFLPHFLIMVIT